MQSIPSIRAPSYRTAHWWPVLMVIFCMSCTSAAPIAGEDLSVRFDHPEDALTAFVGAWNAGDVNAVVGTFAPERRPLLRETTDELQRRTRRSSFVAPRIHSICHPRGAHWKTAEVTVIPKEREQPETRERREVVWLRLQHDTWWMYSL